MKIIHVILFSMLCVAAKAQKTETYYDYDWKPCSPENARFIGILEKTDSGWLRSDYYVSSNRLQMQGLYEDEACKKQNGTFRYFYENGRLSSIGHKVKGEQEGIHIGYHSNGMMSDSAFFHNGRIVDKRFQWHRNGYLGDSINRVNDSTEVQVGWFDDGTLAYAGYLLNGKLNGKWQYFHHNGRPSALEVYEKGKNVSVEYFDENGNLQTDTSAVNREATFKGNENAWRKYLERNLHWPLNLHFTVPASVTVMISFTINENGKPENVEVSLPFHPEFDIIALKLIQNSPAWIPAISHNRKVKTWLRQPITFSQPD